MQDFVLTIELKMGCVPDSEDFKECILGAFISYCKNHPEETVVIKWMHLKFAERTLYERDGVEKLYWNEEGR